ncbi:MAG: hypothetical protein Q9222_003282 [Ikaeria aurantiellina]
MALVRSSKLIENPQLCVSRQISACSICRGKKIKCDGLVPTCTPCQRSRRDAECTNGSDKFARGKERSYVTALESRLDRLEKELAQVNDAAVSGTSKGQRKEQSHLNELVSDFGFLSVNATSRDFDGLAQDVFAQLILAPSTLVDLPDSDVEILPSRPAVTSLVQYYIDHDLSLFPFLPEAKIFGSVEALYEGSAAPSDEWTVFLILAIALSSMSISSDDGNYAEALRYAGAAQKHAKTVLLPGSMQGVQMILLLVQYSMQDPHHLDSWYLIGAAARMTVDLGLHQDPPKALRTRDTELNLRRRVFYSVYSLDRATSFVHRRSFSFTDDSTDVVLPNLQPAVLGSNLHDDHPAAELIQLRQMGSKAYQTLFRSGPEPLQDPWPTLYAAFQDIAEWEDKLHSSTLQQAIKLLLRSEASYIKILLLSPPRLQQPLEDYGQLLLVEYAFQFAGTLASLVKDQVNVSLCTSYDLLRTLFVIQRSVDVLSDHTELCFAESLPRPPSVLTSMSNPPPLPVRREPESLSLATSSLTSLDEIIHVLGSKYGISDAWMQAKASLEKMQTTLRIRSIRVNST